MGLLIANESVVRCGNRIRVGLSTMRSVVLPDVHGPVQLLREAKLPNCRRKQSRAAPDPWSSKPRIEVASAASPTVAGSNTKARSLLLPSPFTSPAIVGVKRVPDVSRPPHVNVTALRRLYDREYARSCVGDAPTPVRTSRGFATVLLNPRYCCDTLR